MYALNCCQLLPGLAASTFEIEAFAFGVNLSNMTMSGMPFSAYGELVFVIIQNVIILMLIHAKTTNNMMRATGPIVLMGTIHLIVYLCEFNTCIELFILIVSCFAKSH